MGKKELLAAVIMLVVGVMLIPNLSSASFSTGFSESGVGDFNLFTAEANSGNFEFPGFSNFRDFGFIPVADWNSTFTDGTHISATGSPLNELIFDVNFAGTLNADGSFSGPLSFDFRSYNQQGVLLDWATVSYKGSGDARDANENWIFTPHEINSVPEPTTMLLLGAGLLGVAGLRKKFRK